jgi:uncharacterized alpha-E superfamily protein
MLSRTADHLYWMARYMERAENFAQRSLGEAKTRTSRLGEAKTRTSRLGEATTLQHATACGGVLGLKELNDAV